MIYSWIFENNLILNFSGLQQDGNKSRPEYDCKGTTNQFEEKCLHERGSYTGYGSGKVRSLSLENHTLNFFKVRGHRCVKIH